MRIQFQERNVDITKALQTQVQRRLSLALGRFALRIDKVIVRLGSDKAPRRSNEKHCQIDVTLRARVLSVRDTDADLAAAVDGAVNRVSRSVARAFERDDW